MRESSPIGIPMEEPAVSLIVNLFLKYTGFSFHDFADSHVVIAMGLVTLSPTHGLQE